MSDIYCELVITNKIVSLKENETIIGIFTAQIQIDIFLNYIAIFMIKLL